MANYDTLKNTLQSNVYQNSNNAVTGAILQNVLMAFINTMGTGSNFMGFLSAANKPTGSVDGKQFYIGYNASTTALSIDLSAVGLGTLSITRSKLYVVHNIGGTWAAVDIAAGLASAITPNNGLLRIMHNGAVITDFSANQSGNTVSEIPVTKVILVDENDNEYGTFMASQKEDDPIKITIPSGGGSSDIGTLTLVMGSFSDTYTGTAKTINLPTPGNGTLKIEHAEWRDNPVKFSANQSSDQRFEIPTTKVTIVASDGVTELGSFLACQTEKVPDIVIPGGGGGGGGTVTSVAMTVPTGLKVSNGSSQTITSTGTFAISFESGYSIPSTANQSHWSSVYNNLGSLNEKNWRNYYYPNVTQKAHADDVYSDSCKINSLKENSVFFLESAQSLDFLGYDYDVSSPECAKSQETYIIVEVASTFTIDFQNQNHYIIANGSSATLDAGGKYLITVIGYFWRIEKYT